MPFVREPTTLGIILFSLLIVPPVYVPVAMIFRLKWPDFLAKKSVWARLLIMLVALIALVTVVAISPKEALVVWNVIVVLLSFVLALLVIVANAPTPTPQAESDAEVLGSITLANGKQSSFWAWAETVNSRSWVSALGVVLASMSLGIWFNSL